LSEVARKEKETSALEKRAELLEVEHYRAMEKVGHARKLRKKGYRGQRTGKRSVRVSLN